MLGDDPSTWPAYPARPPSKLALWTALRATFLHAVWTAHQATDPDAQTSLAVIQAVIRELRSLMRAQFSTAALPAAVLDGLPHRLLTAELRASGLADFQAVWAHRSVLCTVVGEPPDPPSLQLHLTLDHPVAVIVLVDAVGEAGGAYG